MIDCDTDGSGEASAQLGRLELLQGEATTVSNLTGIPACLGGNDWSQLLNGSWEHRSGLGNSTLVATEFGSWLVEVSVILLVRPVFAEMYVWDDVVVLDHC